MRLTVPERHQLNIARKTMRMHCIGAKIMGGPNHKQAEKIILKLTGVKFPCPEDCDCTA